MSIPQEPIVVVIGAGGGLGSAIAHAWAAHGARLILSGRSRGALEATAHTLPHSSASPLIVPADVTDPASVESLCAAVLEAHGRVDVLINAVGADVRKPLLDHDPADLHRLIDVNLYGAIHVTRAFLPSMLEQGSGVIVHLGGFADGRLAFPYYSVDAASRAAVRTFLEAVQREIEGSGVTLSYFSPAPADTDAERPYHPIWREMGTPIVSPDVVAAALVKSVLRGQRVQIAVRLPVFLRPSTPSLPVSQMRSLMRRYSAILKRHFGSPS
ncbi:MAG: SDR family NAD(P)-dependent oxidoreductase [Anaerolineae bacterium]